MKISTLLVCVLSCLVANVLGARKGETLTPEQLAQKRLDGMYELEKSAVGGVINLNADQYLEYVQKNPRPYDVVILWNVPPGKCDHCEAVSDEFNQAAYSFYSHRKDPAKLNNKKIFFAKILFVQEGGIMNVFKNAGFTTIPYLTVSPLDLKRDSVGTDIFTTENKWLISSQEVFDANKQIEFVNNALRTDVKITFTFTAILTKNSFGFVVIALFF